MSLVIRRQAIPMEQGNDAPFGGFVKENSPPPPLTPKFRKFCITEAIFAQNKYKSWRMRYQVSYSNKCLSPTTVTLLAWEAIEFGEITQNNGDYADQCHSRSPMSDQSKDRMRLSD